MPKPAILTVDDDLEVARAIERDLRRQYGGDYRIVRADSGASALIGPRLSTTPPSEFMCPLAPTDLTDHLLPALQR